MTKKLKKRKIVILLVDDDEDDYVVTKNAFEEAKTSCELVWVRDGEQLIKFLKRGDSAAIEAKYPQPDLILLDLNMPKVDGRLALIRIKKDPYMRRIPIVVFTVSRARSDVFNCYDLGANSVIHKPADYEQYVETISTVAKYWLDTAELPRPNLQ